MSDNRFPDLRVVPVGRCCVWRIKRDYRVNKSSAALGLISAVVLAPSVIVPISAHAATAVIMGPTFVPDPSADPDYLRIVAKDYVDATTICKIGNCTLKPLVTPAEFWPITGLNDLTVNQSIAVGLQLLYAELEAQIAASANDLSVFFGNSQSATVLTLAKRALDGLDSAVKGRLSFILLANPNRPNGGLLARVAPTSVPDPGMNAGVATPTDVGIPTIDIAFQYDAVADYPAYPSNVLSLLNTLAGARIHSGSTTTLNGYTEAELTAAINDPANRQIFGDTIYITIPAKSLPMVDVLRAFGAETGLSDLTSPMADLIEPTLRSLVELGYDRTAYGHAQPFGPLPANKQLQLDALTTAATSEGLDAVISALKQGALGPSSGSVNDGWQSGGVSRATLNSRSRTASTTSVALSTVPNKQADAVAAVSRANRGAPSATGHGSVAAASKAAIAKRRSATA